MILVIGDSMLDRYWFGDVTRLSQEAPVPIVKMLREEQRPGAAANVAMNCRAMGAKTALTTVLGHDVYADALQAIVRDHGIANMFVRDIEMKTTQKLRVIGKQQQIARIDFEDRPRREAVEAMNRAAETMIGTADIVIISDYGKGALIDVHALISHAKALGKTVLVDPKGHDYSKYRGADLVKPNINEMRELCGGWDSEDQLAEKARNLLKHGDFGGILLTRAADGMSLFSATEDPIHIQTVAKEVFDVSGAGDTAIAAFAVALSRGHPLADAVCYANKASGIVVGRFGTAVANEQEVFG